jgi:hypothetical protein
VVAKSVMTGSQPAETTPPEPHVLPGGRVTLAVVAVLVVALSIGVAALSSVASRLVWRPDPVVVPWGMLLGVAASASIVWLARAVSRRMGLVAAAGWIVGTGLVLGGRPEGDYLLAQDALGISYLLISAVVVISVAAGGAPR